MEEIKKLEEIPHAFRAVFADGTEQVMVPIGDSIAVPSRETTSVPQSEGVATVTAIRRSQSGQYSVELSTGEEFDVPVKHLTSASALQRYCQAQNIRVSMTGLFDPKAWNQFIKQSR